MHVIVDLLLNGRSVQMIISSASSFICLRTETFTFRLLLSANRWVVSAVKILSTILRLPPLEFDFLATRRHNIERIRIAPKKHLNVFIYIKNIFRYMHLNGPPSFSA